jgi:hypothetical protein
MLPPVNIRCDGNGLWRCRNGDHPDGNLPGDRLSQRPVVARSPHRATAPDIVGRRLFTDGVTRDVFEDADGRQYIVHEDTGERIYGQLLWPADEPVVKTIQRPEVSP